MPIATYTDFVLNANWNQTSLGTVFRSALEACGLTFISSDTAGATHTHLFSYVVNPSATKSTCYIEIQIPAPTTSVIPTMRIADNLSLTGATSVPLSSAATLSLASQLDLRSFSHPEFRAAVVRVAGTARFTIGFIRPLNKPSWWSENSFLYAFASNPVSTAYALGGFFTSPNPFSLTPSSNTSVFYAGAGTAGQSSFNAPTPPLAGGRDILFGAPIVGTSSGSTMNLIGGWFSNDFILAGAGGLSLFDTLSTSGQSYMLLEPPSSSYMSLAIRVL